MNTRVNSNDPEKKEIVTRRAAIVSGGFSLLLLGIGARLAQLQIVDHNKYMRLAQENQFNTRIITPLRGEIVDRFGKTLASNRQNFRVLLMPDEAGDIEEALAKIRTIVAISDDKHAKLLREIRRTQGYAPVEVVNNLEWNDFSKINFELPHLPGAHPEVERGARLPARQRDRFRHRLCQRRHRSRPSGARQ